ncbi:hypothetical protein IEQ34_021830 [Dendrobium chrysotoxum]|uniref:Uncharacterized protein n=1 Tax=Dendrobium chrysotoxum TaxID=161865 RepID=A0AAV7FVT5_DENCH|nr:hypothetical protein IEQ34_021830 [Dendrobium chrysotoxum]
MGNIDRECIRLLAARKWTQPYDLEFQVSMAFGGTKGGCGGDRLSSLGVISGDTIPAEVAAKNLFAIIRNEYICERVGVAPVTNKIIKNVLDLAYVRKCRGRPKKDWLEGIRNDLSLLDLNENLTLNRAQ